MRQVLIAEKSSQESCGKVNLVTILMKNFSQGASDKLKYKGLACEKHPTMVGLFVDENLIKKPKIDFFMQEMFHHDQKIEDGAGHIGQGEGVQERDDLGIGAIVVMLAILGFVRVFPDIEVWVGVHGRSELISN